MDLLSAFVVGLVGSLHCAGMCGPLALALPHPGGGSVRFLTGRLAYNGGRLLTYIALGGLAGTIGQSLRLAGVQRWLSIALGISLLAGLLLARRMGAWIPVTVLVGGLKTRMAGLLSQPTLGAQTVLGMLNGLLPCGLVYVACAGAAATGHFARGAAYMAVFGLGTVPLMLAIGLSGALIPLSLRLRLRKAIPVAISLLGVLLILRGMSLGIPYVSPHLDATGSVASCCH